MSDITPAPTFEDIILNKLRKDIGEMMPEDALKSVVSKAMERIFFEPMKIPRGGYSGGYDVAAYSWVENECKSLLKDRMNDAIRDYLKDNPEMVKKAVDEAIAGGIVAAMGNALQTILYNATAPLQNELYKALNR